MLAEPGADGVNLLNCSGAEAWQTVFHFHLHVIPRYPDKSKDRLQLPFEPGRPADPEAIAKRAKILAAVLQGPGSCQTKIVRVRFPVREESP